MPTDTPDLAAIRERAAHLSDGGTHWDGCERVHWTCAVIKCLAHIDRLTAERDAQAARIEVLEKALDQIATQRFSPCETNEATIARAALTPPPEPRP